MPELFGMPYLFPAIVVVVLLAALVWRLVARRRRQAAKPPTEMTRVERETEPAASDPFERFASPVSPARVLLAPRRTKPSRQTERRRRRSRRRMSRKRLTGHCGNRARRAGMPPGWLSLGRAMGTAHEGRLSLGRGWRAGDDRSQEGRKRKRAASKSSQTARGRAAVAGGSLKRPPGPAADQARPRPDRVSTPTRSRPSSSNCCMAGESSRPRR